MKLHGTIEWHICSLWSTPKIQDNDKKLFLINILVNHIKATFFCDFDQNQCNIVVDYTQELDWRRYSERQLPFTGPDADLSGNGK